MKGGQQIECGVATHIGYWRVRNEDSFLCCDDLRLWAVADGVGGRPCGDVASANAVASLERTLRQSDHVKNAFLAADMEVSRYADTSLKCNGMLTTLCAARLRKAAADIVWVGDSDCFYLAGRNDGELNLLNSPLNSKARQPPPFISVLEIRRRFLGTGNLTTAELGHLTLDIEDGDLLILATDGLIKDLHIAGITAICREHRSHGAQSIANALINASLSNGGHDNVTVITLLIGSRAS